MHETLLHDVRLHVDEVSPQEDNTLIKGWCASDSAKIKEIRVFINKNKTFAGFPNEKREDVYEFYDKNENFLNSGFTIPVPEKVESREDIFLQVLHENKWQNVVKLDDQVSVSLKEINTGFDINEHLDLNLIVVDDFYEDPYLIREFALSRSSYNPHIEYHKGQRTEETFKPDGVKKVLGKLLHKKITGWDEHGANGVFQFCTAEDAVVYHVDTQSYAAVVFLTPDAPPEAGTTFYRSKVNGLREDPNSKIAEQLNKTKEQLSSEIFSSGFYDKTKFEVVDVVGNVFNRLVIWDAKLIHAASEYFGSNLHDSRLFHMFFFDTEKL
jgi:hypothetical protein